MMFVVLKNAFSCLYRFLHRFCFYQKNIFAFSLLFIIFLVLVPESFAQRPDLFLLNKYQESQDVTSWVMSEKFDGVRAYWNGRQLLSRGGNVFNAPQWFLQDLPPFALDGELWTKRKDFENIVSIVRQQQPDDRWSQVSYRIFEVPDQPGDFLQRLSVIKTYLKLVRQKSGAKSLSHLIVIPQLKIKDQAHLNIFFKQVTNLGGEGVVVRDPAAGYQTGRLKNALKVKSYQDDECEVIGYRSGRGKYRGMAGALRCKLSNQKIIGIGSGLSDMQRKNPPVIGSIITFKHYGSTAKGLPRFPVFLRQRELATKIR